MVRRIGSLDRLVTIQSRIETQDSFGQPIQTWVDVGAFWSKLEDAAGNTRLVGAEVVAGAERVYNVHWHAGITTRHRLLDESVAWDIVRVVEQQRRSGLLLYVVKPGNEDQS